jgi:hypothetical protein
LEHWAYSDVGIGMKLLEQDKVQDAGRALKSKTKEVVQYGAPRNTDTT